MKKNTMLITLIVVFVAFLLFGQRVVAEPLKLIPEVPEAGKPFLAFVDLDDADTRHRWSAFHNGIALNQDTIDTKGSWLKSREAIVGQYIFVLHVECPNGESRHFVAAFEVKPPNGRNDVVDSSIRSRKTADDSRWQKFRRTSESRPDSEAARSAVSFSPSDSGTSARLTATSARTLNQAPKTEGLVEDIQKRLFKLDVHTIDLRFGETATSMAEAIREHVKSSTATVVDEFLQDLFDDHLGPIIDDVKGRKARDRWEEFYDDITNEAAARGFDPDNLEHIKTFYAAAADGLELSIEKREGEFRTQVVEYLIKMGYKPGDITSSSGGGSTASCSSHRHNGCCLFCWGRHH